MMKDINNYSTKELLTLQKKIYDILRDRDIIRTNNNLVGDLGEKLFAEAFNWTLAKNSTCGYDCMTSNGLKYQIKARRCDENQKTVRFSAIRDLDDDKFDYLGFVVFDESFNICKAMIMPKSSVPDLCHHQDYTNSDILCINLNTVDSIAEAKDVTDIITNTLNKL